MEKLATIMEVNQNIKTEKFDFLPNIKEWLLANGYVCDTNAFSGIEYKKGALSIIPEDTFTKGGFRFLVYASGIMLPNGNSPLKKQTFEEIELENENKLNQAQDDLKEFVARWCFNIKEEE